MGKISEPFFFLHMCDPQLFLGEHALENWQASIARANELKPAFVVVGGDLTHCDIEPDKRDPETDEALAEAYLSVTRDLDTDIPLYQMAGNHDVCNVPTAETLRWYQERFGDLWYAFEHQESLFVVVESNLMVNPENVPEIARHQMSWLKETLESSLTKPLRHRFVLTHYPIALESIEEEDQYFNVPRPLRQELMALFEACQVDAVLSGHYHGNAFVEHAGIQLITTGPIGYSIREDTEPGFRIVKVYPEKWEHEYYPHTDLPHRVIL